MQSDVLAQNSDGQISEIKDSRRIATQALGRRSFWTNLPMSLQTTTPLKNETKSEGDERFSFNAKLKRRLPYYIPILNWLPKYKLQFFKNDLIAGITVAAMVIPQG